MMLWVRTVFVMTCFWLTFVLSRPQELQKPHFQVDHEAGKLKIEATKDSADITFTNDNVDLLLKPGDSEQPAVVVNHESKTRHSVEKSDKYPTHEERAKKEGITVEDEPIATYKQNSLISNNTEIKPVDAPNKLIDNIVDTEIHNIRKEYLQKKGNFQNRELRNNANNLQNGKNKENNTVINWKGRLKHISDDHVSNSHVMNTLNEIKSLMKESIQKENKKERTMKDEESEEDKVAARFGKKFLNGEIPDGNDVYLNAANAVIRKVEQQERGSVSAFSKPVSSYSKSTSDGVDYVARAKEILNNYKDIDSLNIEDDKPDESESNSTADQIKDDSQSVIVTPIQKKVNSLQGTGEPIFNNLTGEYNENMEQEEIKKLKEEGKQNTTNVSNDYEGRNTREEFKNLSKYTSKQTGQSNENVNKTQFEFQRLSNKTKNLMDNFAEEGSQNINKETARHNGTTGRISESQTQQNNDSSRPEQSSKKFNNFTRITEYSNNNERERVSANNNTEFGNKTSQVTVHDSTLDKSINTSKPFENNFPSDKHESNSDSSVSFPNNTFSGAVNTTKNTELLNSTNDDELQKTEASERAYSSIDMDAEAVKNATEDSNRAFNFTEEPKDKKQEEVYATIDNNLTRNMTKEELELSNKTTANVSKDDDPNSWKHYLENDDDTSQKLHSHHLRRIVAWAPAKIKEDSQEKTKLKVNNGNHKKTKVKLKVHHKLKQKVKIKKKDFKTSNNRPLKQRYENSKKNISLLLKPHKDKSEYMKPIHLNPKSNDKMDENQYQNELENYKAKFRVRQKEYYARETKNKETGDEVGEICDENCQQRNNVPDKLNMLTKYPVNESESRTIYEEAEVKTEAKVENQQTAEDEKTTEAELEHAKELANDVARELNETAYNSSPFEAHNADNFTKIDTAKLHYDESKDDNIRNKKLNDARKAVDLHKVDLHKVDVHQVDDVKLVKIKGSQDVDIKENGDEVGDLNKPMSGDKSNDVLNDASETFSKNESLKVEETDLTPEEKQAFENDKDWSVESNTGKVKENGSLVESNDSLAESNNGKSNDKSGLGRSGKNRDEQTSPFLSGKVLLSQNVDRSTSVKNLNATEKVKEENLRDGGYQTLINNLDVLANGVSSFVDNSKNKNENDLKLKGEGNMKINSDTATTTKQSEEEFRKTDENETKQNEKTDETETKQNKKAGETETKKNEKTDENETKQNEKTDENETKQNEKTGETETKQNEKTDENETQQNEKTDETETKQNEKTGESETKQNEKTGENETKQNEKTGESETKQNKQYKENEATQKQEENTFRVHEKQTGKSFGGKIEKQEELKSYKPRELEGMVTLEQQGEDAENTDVSKKQKKLMDNVFSKNKGKMIKKQENQKKKDKLFNVNKQERVVAAEMLKTLDMNSLTKTDQDTEQKVEDLPAKEENKVVDTTLLDMEDSSEGDIKNKSLSQDKTSGLLPKGVSMKHLSDEKVKETINKNFQELFQETFAKEAINKEETAPHNSSIINPVTLDKTKSEDFAFEQVTPPKITANHLDLSKGVDISAFPGEVRKELGDKKIELNEFPSLMTEHLKTNAKLPLETKSETTDGENINSAKEVHIHPTEAKNASKVGDNRSNNGIGGKTTAVLTNLPEIKIEKERNNEETQEITSEPKNNDNSADALSSDVSNAMEELEQLMKEKSNEAKEMVATKPQDDANVKNEITEDSKATNVLTEINKQDKDKDFIKATDIKTLEEDPLKAMTLFKRNNTETKSGDDYFPNKDADNEITQMLDGVVNARGNMIQDKFFPSQKNIEKLLSDGTTFQRDEEIKLDFAKSVDNKEQESMVEKVLQKYQRASELLTKRLHQLQKVDIVSQNAGDSANHNVGYHTKEIEKTEAKPDDENKINETSADFYGNEEDYDEEKSFNRKKPSKVVNALKKHYGIHKNGTINEDTDETSLKEKSRVKKVVQVVNNEEEKTEEKVAKEEDKELLKWNEDENEQVTKKHNKSHALKNDTVLDGEEQNNDTQNDAPNDNKHEENTKEEQIENKPKTIENQNKLTKNEEKNVTEERTLEENQQMINEDKQVREELNEQKAAQLNEENKNEEKADEKPSDIIKDIKADFDQQKLVNNQLRQYSDKERKEAEQALQEMDKLTEDEKIVPEANKKSEEVKNKTVKNEGLKEMMTRLDGYSSEEEKKTNEQSKKDESKNPLSKQDESKNVQSNQEETKNIQSNQDESNEPESKQDTSRKEDPKTEDDYEGVPFKEPKPVNTDQINKSDASETNQPAELNNKDVTQSKDSTDSKDILSKDTTGSTNATQYKEPDDSDTTQSKGTSQGAEKVNYVEILKEKGIEAEKAALQQYKDKKKKEEENEEKAKTEKTQEFPTVNEQKETKNIKEKSSTSDIKSEFEKNFEDTTKSLLNSKLMNKLQTMAEMQHEYVLKHKTTVDPYSTFKRSKFMKKVTKKKLRHSG